MNILKCIDNEIMILENMCKYKNIEIIKKNIRN